MLTVGDLEPVDSGRLPGPTPASQSSSAGPAAPLGPTPAISRSRLVIPALVVAGDVLAIGVAALVAGPRLSPPWVVLSMLLVGWLLAIGGHHRPRYDLTVLDRLAGLAGRTVAGLVIALAIRQLVTDGSDPAASEVALIVTGAVLVVGVRALIWAVVRGIRRQGRARRRTIVVAGESTVFDLARAGDVHPEAGLDLVACFERSIDLEVGAATAELGPVDAVIVEVGAFDRGHDAGLVAAASRLGARLYQISPTPAIDSALCAVDRIGWVPLLPLRSGRSTVTRWSKRAIDVALGSILLVLALPLMAACALVLRAESGPGVLFRQRRVGQDGRHFTMVKLRTIVPASHEQADATWYTGEEEMTRFARFLRATSIDELPQLWNVIRGEMSLVGPRPERPHFADRFSASIPGYDDRHRMPAGLTGLAQVHGLRGDTSISERARLDNAYIDSWSLRQDVKIMIRTVGSVLGRRSETP